VSTLIERLCEAKARGDIAPVLHSIPYARWLGISYERVGEEWLGKLAFAEHLVGNPALPALHGGVVGALLESTAIYHVLHEAETLALPKTITVTIDFLRSAGPRDCWARGEIVRHGRRVVTVRSIAWQEDPALPVAAANVHLLLAPVEDGEQR